MSGHPPAQVPVSSGVRRVHTISASSRAAYANDKTPISEETDDQQLGYGDEVVDQDWVGGAGIVGEKSGGLHRQASLPTSYHRASMRGQASRAGGTMTPSALSAIAGHEGDERDWGGLRGWREEEENRGNPELSQMMESGGAQSPMSPQFQAAPSPPPASDLRRHQSMTAGSGSRVNPASLRRHGTLQATIKHADAHRSPSPTQAEEGEYVDDPQSLEDEPYQPNQGQGQYPGSPIGRHSPWSSQAEWLTGGNGNTANPTIDDVSRALSAIELSGNNGPGQTYNQNSSYPMGQSTHPPRFNPMQQGHNMQQATVRHDSFNNGQNAKLQLVTNFDGRKTPVSQGHGPASASAYVPPIGHTVPQQGGSMHYRHATAPGGSTGDDKALTASGTTTWDQKERLLGRSSNPNLGYLYNEQARQNIPSVPQIPAQYLERQTSPKLSNYGQASMSLQSSMAPAAGSITSPIDVPTLIATKGYNPNNFDIRPLFARYFVIKSYTEDDVHKSLKYEIWSSTDPGNKRLDKAFKECAGRGPIYLFFSVNASGHFCGMAEMLTPVDYTRSSTVWASDKWKGVFKVRWIFVRDIPNANLRHIRLNNTQERKPVTNSRDTQELLPEAGQEMLRIFHTHPARTSLLQDFAFYELQAVQKAQAHTQGPQSSQGTSQPSSRVSSPPQQVSPTLAPQQVSFGMANTGPYGAQPMQMPQMNPMMQMQMMNMGMGMGAQGMGMGMTPPFAMQQSVMRHPTTPGAQIPSNAQTGFMGMGGAQF